MTLHLGDGLYVLAISGGVDSMALLDMAVKSVNEPRKHLLVAHFNHGIRADADEDEKLVKTVAEQHGLQFVSGNGHLGAGASEEKARNSRYEFLYSVMSEYRAKAIVTAHHQDDVIETAIINLLRGTGRRGLTSLKSTPTIYRPLLNYPKKDLIAYATSHRLAWREDITNSDPTYLRNRVRGVLTEKMSDDWRAAFLKEIHHAHNVNIKIDHELSPIVARLTHRHGATLSRSLLTSVSHDLAIELVAAILRKINVQDVTSALLERIVVAAKVMKPGKKLDIDKTHHIFVTKRSIRIIHTATGKTVHV